MIPPEAGREVAVDVRDPEGGERGRLAATTDAEGSYAVAWRVPADAALGTYSVIASVGHVAGRARLVIG